MDVLIVDDNAGNRLLIKNALRGQGYTTHFAETGIAALARIAEDKPDLVILDINMPGMSGFEVCSHLKSDPETSGIPILMLTAQGDIDSRVKGLGLGADDYITKPYSPRELIARINTHLRIKTDSDALRTKERLIRSTFERFVSPAVVNRLLENPDTVRLGGALQEVTVLFADLQGFTTLAEHTEPARLLAMLNAYHELLVTHIQAQDGTFDKFMGDGVMALYNTPLPQPDHALRAIRTALNIQRALPEFHATLAPEYRLPVNFGIHTGQAVVGIIGTSNMMDYTAIGDTVNLASRLQGLSQNGAILLSEATAVLVQEHVTIECLGAQTLRNRATPVVVYRTGIETTHKSIQT